MPIPNRWSYHYHQRGTEVTRSGTVGSKGQAIENAMHNWRTFGEHRATATITSPRGIVFRYEKHERCPSKRVWRRAA